jgi:hypothetical protein
MNPYCNSSPSESLYLAMSSRSRGLLGLLIAVFLVASCGTKPATVRGTPPVDLAYYSTYAHPASDPIQGLATVYSLDWTGSPHATIRIAQPAGVGPKNGPAPRMIRSVSPDGSRLLLSDGTVLDQSGHPVGQIDQTAGFEARWAEDDAHLCELTVPGYASFKGGTLEGPVSLLWTSLTSKPRAVAIVGSAGATDSVEVVACNRGTDRAVVMQSTIVSVPNRNTMSAIPAAKELMVIEISTGRFLYRHTYPIGSQPLSGTEVVVSRDGNYAAESLHYAALEMKLSRDPASATTIRELPSGRELGTIDSGNVVAFSGDDSLVLTTTSHAADSLQSQLIDWKSGHPAWKRSGGFQFVLANSRGRAFLIVQDEALWLTREDGAWQQIATGVDELWSLSGR